MNVFEALSAVMNEVQGVGKKDRNSAQGFNFRGIDAVVNAVGPALRKHGVIVVPRVEEYAYDSVEVGKNRTPMGHVQVLVDYVFYGPEGDSLQTRVIGEAMDSGDKAVAKAMSVAFRIALLQALCLPTDEPDPDHSSYERSPVVDEVQAVSDLLRGASTLDELSAAAEKAQKVRGSEAQMSALRVLYSARKAELGEGS